MSDNTMMRGAIAGLRMCGGVLILLGLLAIHVHAQTLAVLASFSGSNGQTPRAGLTLSGDTLYGTTYNGGANGYGTIFSVPVSGGSPTVLASFNGSNGQNPCAGLALSGNSLYGTTLYGGENGYGAIFSVPVSGGSLTVLASFNGSNGEYPEADLTLSGSTLYGTTANGGDGGVGTIFSIPVSGGSPTVLASLLNINNSGYGPSAGLTLSGSTLYGTNYAAGAYGDGTVFSVPVRGGSVAALASFNGSNGEFPEADLVLSGNTQYGTTVNGGANGYGTIFSVPMSGGSPTVLASFNGSNGAYPRADLMLSGDTLYGTTSFAGTASYGTVFSIPVNGGSPTVLASFSGSNGGYPWGGLTLSGSTWYGTTIYGGAYGDGTVFALNLAPTPEPSTLTLLGVGAMGLIAYVWRRRRAKAIVRLLLTAALLASAVSAQADVFNMPSGETGLQFVTVGNPGNAPDTTVMNDRTTGYGSVPYVYQIGKYDVTLGQYTQFLNAVATTDTYGLYNSYMAGGNFITSPLGISRSGNPGSYSYSVTGANPEAANMPVFDISWGDAARFCNWLDNGQPTGVEGNGTTETGAYLLSGATSNAQLMSVASPAHSGITAPQYFLPTENEWYKAAYYKSGGTDSGYWSYPTQSSIPPDNSLVLAATSTNDANYYINGYTDAINHYTPVGTFAASPSAYGAYDMGGDVFQFNETSINGLYRGLRGVGFSNVGDSVFGISSSNRQDDYPANFNYNEGFRVASIAAVPEPGSLALLLAGVVALGIWRLRQKA